MPTEFELIERFLSPFPRRGGGVVVGPGDDCAVLRATPGTELCVTTDALVESVHFDPALFTDADIGHKALAVNLSDIAAMGATPRWFVCSIACRPEDARRIPRIARGMAALAVRAGARLVGGNFTRADSLSLHITAAGEVAQGGALTRSGAQPGDLVYVTGMLGDAALALDLREVRDAMPKAKAAAILRRQLRPEPRIAAGRIARRFAHAAIDISDGLLQDLGHVVEQSGVGMRIDARAVPTSRAFRDAGAHLDLALSGGEDYELAVLVPPDRSRAFERACRAANESVTRIGVAIPGRRLQLEHAPHLRRRGFDHFHRPAKPA